MAEHPHPHSIDPSNASQEHAPQSKQCSSCCANIPLASFGVLRYAKSGYRDVCKECRKQSFRLYRKAKFNSKSYIEDEVIRNVVVHNTQIVTQLINSTLEIRAFNTITKMDYKVFFGRSKFNDMQSVAFFDYNGNLFREFNYSGQDPTVIKSIISILRHHKLRLEYTDGDVVTSKSTIYYV